MVVEALQPVHSESVTAPPTNDIDESMQRNTPNASTEDHETEETKLPSDVNESDHVDFSSDEEFETNRIGDVPIEWYDDYEHVGYDASGSKVLKTGKDGKTAQMDDIDRLIASADDPMFRRTIFDERNNESIVLTNRELNLVKRMVDCNFVNETSTFEAEPDYNPYFSSKILKMPLDYDKQTPKRHFLPNKWEKMKIIKIIRGIREGKILPEEELQARRDKKPGFYLLWDDADKVPDLASDYLISSRNKRHVPAPKLTLPGHSESYHPPAEYLLTPEEEAKFDAMYEEDKGKQIKPMDYQKMRHIPGYQALVKEQFERCLDLYLCTRVKKDRLNIDPESLVPKLPQPKDLRPFPNTQALTYFGHQGQVRALAISANGELMASGDSRNILKIWEVESTKCLKTLDLNVILNLKSEIHPEEDENDPNPKPKKVGCISKVTFNPKFNLLAVSISRFVLLFYIGNLLASGDEISAAKSQEMFFNKESLNAKQKEEVESEVAGEEEEQEDGDNEKVVANKKIKLVEWSLTGSVFRSLDGNLSQASVADTKKQSFIKLEMLDHHSRNIVDLAWHPKGLYLASVSDSLAKRKHGQVLVHHIAKKESQRLFGQQHATSKAAVQRICFHPKRPVLFVATRQNVFCQDLVKKTQLKRLRAGSRWISSLAVHPSGDHVIVGGYDKRVNWFDLDLKDDPFKSMKFHSKAVRAVAFHPRYPLMATGSDDGAAHVFHARVFSDLMRNPMIVPVKNLDAHYVKDGFGIFQVEFHPTQPWLFTAGADGNVHLFQNVP